MSVLFSSSLTVLAVPREAAFLLLLHVCGHSLTTRTFCLYIENFFFLPCGLWLNIQTLRIDLFVLTFHFESLKCCFRRQFSTCRCFFFQSVDQVQSVEVMMSCVWNCANQRCKKFCRGCRNVWWTLCRRLKYFLSLCRLFNSIMCC